MLRFNFNELFTINPDGSIEPKRLIKIGGVQMGPGVRFGRGVSFGGIDLFQFIGRDFSAQMEGPVVVLVGIF